MSKFDLIEEAETLDRALLECVESTFAQSFTGSHSVVCFNMDFLA